MSWRCHCDVCDEVTDKIEGEWTQFRIEGVTARRPLPIADSYVVCSHRCLRKLFERWASAVSVFVPEPVTNSITDFIRTGPYR